jgi:hypothetical protein
MNILCHHFPKKIICSEFSLIFFYPLCIVVWKFLKRGYVKIGFFVCTLFIF